MENTMIPEPQLSQDDSSESDVDSVASIRRNFS